jgi:hypothetical protein
MPLDDTNWSPAPPAKADEATALLTQARNFLERGWCRNWLAVDTTGIGVDPTAKKAVAWCAWGALTVAGLPRRQNEVWENAIDRLKAAINYEDIANFNNRQETVEPVLAAFDKAIGLIEFVAEGEAFDAAIAAGGR